MPFTSNLSELMRERKLTDEELQFRSKVAPDTIARVKDERIATVKLLTLEKLATALEVDVHDLFEYVRTSPSSFER